MRLLRMDSEPCPENQPQGVSADYSRLVRVVSLRLVFASGSSEGTAMSRNSGLETHRPLSPRADLLRRSRDSRLSSRYSRATTPLAKSRAAALTLA